jgi:hypothetical protein
MAKRYNRFSVPASGQTNAGGVSFLFHAAVIKPRNEFAGEKISRGDNGSQYQ